MQIKDSGLSWDEVLDEGKEGFQNSLAGFYVYSRVWI
jgi:hypothetical protein